MKAISIRQPWATLIALKYKTIELRTWRPKYRGDLLICASLGDIILPTPERDIAPGGFALAIAELYEVRPTQPADLGPSLEPKHATFKNIKNDFAWLLRNIRPVQPFHVRGKLSIYSVDDSLIHPLSSEFDNHLSFFKAIAYQAKKATYFKDVCYPEALTKKTSISTQKLLI
ncbi:MAG: ASCH domain-containing protein [Desulfovibrionaceae bacterium]|nr:ASCH domain-containing protein [Desulfovibrionaceae bacterium]